jgi:hypothetical protein
MSWTIDEEKLSDRISDFETAIDKAAGTALILCALSDTGRAAKVSYPADFENTSKISSYSMNKGPRKDSEYHHGALYFPAEQLDVLQLPEYFDEKDPMPLEGSSYATALAAGIASFVLQCVQFAYHPDTPTAEQPEVVTKKLHDYKRRELRHLFRGRMRDPNEKEKNLVQPWRLFDNGNWKGVQETDRKKLARLRDILNRPN